MFVGPWVSAPVTVPFDFEALWRASLRRSGLKHEVVALLMGIPATLLSRQVQGHGHISLQRTFALIATADGRRFVRALLLEYLAVTGLGEVDPFLDWLREGIALVARVRSAQAKALEAPVNERRSA